MRTRFIVSSTPRMKFRLLIIEGIKMKKLFILLLISVPVIQAQQKGEQKDTLEVKMKQITVTATRYAEQVLEIPYAVSVIQGNKLKNLRGYGLDEILNTVPGVLVQNRAGNQDVRLVIRGFGARGAGDRSNSGTSRGIRVMIDGIPETEPDGRTSFDQIDLSIADKIEIIRSNASAVWGNGAGGVVNLSTVPESSEAYLSFRSSAGSYGYNDIQLSSLNNFKNGKMFSSLSNTNFEGWRDHSSSYRTLFNTGFLSNLDDLTRLGVFISGTSNMFHIPGPLTQKQFDADPSRSNPVYEQRDERRFNRLGKIGVTLNREFDETNSVSGMLFLNPKYLQRSERGTFRDFTRYHTGGNLIYANHSSFSRELKNKLVVGTDFAYQDGAILFYNLSPTNGRGNELKDNKREGAENFGAFLQNEILIKDKFSFIAGARYDNIKYYSESFISSGYGLQTKTFERVTPKAGITYHLSDSHSLYANYGGGIEVPAGNETDPAGTYGQDQIYLINPLLEPIISNTFEIGTKQFKTDFAEDNFIKSLSYELALYYISVKNDIVPYRGGRFYFTAGKTERKGAEFAASLQFRNNLSLICSFTLTDNKYKEYLVDSVHYDLKKAGRYADYGGNKVAGIPDYFYNIGLTYLPEGLGGAFISLNLNSIGKYFCDDANTLEVNSFRVLSGTIGMSKPVVLTNKLKIRGFLTVNNLFDSKYASSTFINPDIVNGDPVFLEPGMPRNFVLSVSIIY